MQSNQAEPTGAALAVPGSGAVDVATVDAVTRLMAQMERTARAQRPIVIRDAAPAPVDVTIPSLPTQGTPPPLPAESVPPRRRLYTRPEAYLRAGLAGTAAGTLALGTGGSTAAGAAAVGSLLFALGCAIAIVRDDERPGR